MSLIIGLSAYTICVIYLAATIGHSVGLSEGMQNGRIDAVKNGHGVWVVTDDGKTFFKWKDRAND